MSLMYKKTFIKIFQISNSCKSVRKLSVLQKRIQQFYKMIVHHLQKKKK